MASRAWLRVSSSSPRSASSSAMFGQVPAHAGPVSEVAREADPLLRGRASKVEAAHGEKGRRLRPERQRKDAEQPPLPRDRDGAGRVRQAVPKRAPHTAHGRHEGGPDQCRRILELVSRADRLSQEQVGAFIFARELSPHATQCGDPEAVDIAVRLDRGGPCPQGRAMRVVPRIVVGLHRLGQRVERERSVLAGIGGLDQDRDRTAQVPGSRFDHAPQVEELRADPAGRKREGARDQLVGPAPAGRRPRRPRRRPRICGFFGRRHSTARPRARTRWRRRRARRAPHTDAPMPRADPRPLRRH